MASLPPSGPLNIGDVLLKWQIRGLLGRGGHAWVYHGYDPFLEREVAIKIIPSPSESEPERDLRQRAQREAQVLSKLEHENIVRLIDAGLTGDSAVYIVMEILLGRTLREVIRSFGSLTVVEALLLGAKVAAGVQAAHEVNVIHRDLKPENVFVVENNGLKVLDFGIAKLFGPGAVTTQRDLLHGTMKYMSPEHLLGLGVSERSDIFALGTMLYETLCGCVPCLVGVQEPTNNALIYAQINRVPPLLDELLPAFPRFVARTIHRMLAKAPEDRFATMAEVAKVLRANLERYLRDSNGMAPAARELWRAALVSASDPVRLGHATTELHQLQPLSDLAPPTAPPVTLATLREHDTIPVSKPPFSAPGAGTDPGLKVQVPEPMRIVAAEAATLPRPTPAAWPRVEASNTWRRRITPNAEAPAPPAQADLQRAASASQSPVAGSSRRVRSVPVHHEHPDRVRHEPRVASRSAPAPTRDRQARPRPDKPQPSGDHHLLLVAFPLGAIIGLTVGLIGYWHPHAPATKAEEAMVTVSTEPPPVGPRPPAQPIEPTPVPAVAPKASAVVPMPKNSASAAAADPVVPIPAAADLNAPAQREPAPSGSSDPGHLIFRGVE